MRNASPTTVESMLAPSVTATFVISTSPLVPGTVAAVIVCSEAKESESMSCPVPIRSKATVQPIVPEVAVAAAQWTYTVIPPPA